MVNPHNTRDAGDGAMCLSSTAINYGILLDADVQGAVATTTSKRNLYTVLESNGSVACNAREKLNGYLNLSTA